MIEFSSLNFFSFIVFCLIVFNQPIQVQLYNYYMSEKQKRQKKKCLKFNKFIHHRPKTYFDLVEKVGSSGKYQTNMIIIFCLIWASAGLFVLNLHLFFISERFTCSSFGLIAHRCHQHVCKLPKQIWDSFVVQDDKISTSIAMQLGPYYCSDHIYLEYSKYICYLGVVFSILIFSYIGDNIGRRKALIFSLLQFAIGTILLSISTNLPMVTIALFLCMGGSTCSAIHTFPFLNEMFENSKRQKYSILQLISFSVFGILGTLFLYIISNWRIFSISLLTFPSCLNLFLSWLYIEETPLFLLRRQNSRTLKCLNRIGKINFKIQQILEEQDLISVKIQMENNQQFNQISINLKSILKLPSLRSNFICCLIFGVVVFLQFYAPSAHLFQQNQNHIFMITFLIRLTEIFVFLPIYFYIQAIQKNTFSKIIFLVSGLITIILIPLRTPSGEFQQIQAILQLIFVIVHRAFISIVISYSYIYISELLPLKINAHVLGYSTIFIPFTIMILQNILWHRISVFVLTTIFSLISLGVIFKLKKTKGCSMTYQIQQIQQIKDRKKRQQPVRQTFRRSSMIKSLHQDKMKKLDDQFIKSEYIQ